MGMERKLDPYTREYMINSIKEWCKKHGITRFETDRIYLFILDFRSEPLRASNEDVRNVYDMFIKYHKQLDTLFEFCTENKRFRVLVDNSHKIMVDYLDRVLSTEPYLTVIVYTAQGPSKTVLSIEPDSVYIYYYIDAYISMEELVSSLVMM